MTEEHYFLLETVNIDSKRRFEFYSKYAIEQFYTKEEKEENTYFTEPSTDSSEGYNEATMKIASWLKWDDLWLYTKQDLPNRLLLILEPPPTANRQNILDYLESFWNAYESSRPSKVTTFDELKVKYRSKCSESSNQSIIKERTIDFHLSKYKNLDTGEWLNLEFKKVLDAITSPSTEWPIFPIRKANSQTLINKWQWFEWNFFLADALFVHWLEVNGDERELAKSSVKEDKNPDSVIGITIIEALKIHFTYVDAPWAEYISPSQTTAKGNPRKGKKVWFEDQRFEANSTNVRKAFDKRIEYLKYPKNIELVMPHLVGQALVKAKEQLNQINRGCTQANLGVPTVIN